MGLRVELSDSRHWMLNGLLVNPVVLPLATWFVTKQVEGMLEGVIKAAVEEIGSFAHVVAVEMNENKQSMWSAITHAIGTLLPESNDETGVEPTLSMKGVQMNIVAQPEGEEPDTALAVGVVPQLLPAKGEPAPLEWASSVYERAVDEVHDAEDRVVGEVREAEGAIREGVGALRDVMDDAQRMGSEEATDGWRSDAFDIA